MKSHAGRQIYEALFWVAVCFGGYYYWGLIDSRIRGGLNDQLGPYGDLAFGLCVIVSLFTLNFVKEAISSTFTAAVMRLSTGGPVSYEGKHYESSLLRSAAKLEKRGDFQGAGEIYESLHHWTDAARVLESSGMLSRAAAAWEKAGNIIRAIDLYEREKNYELAASRAQTEGLRDRAIRNFRLAGEKFFEENSFTQAAQFFEKALEFERAGGIYETLKRDNDALRCYERAGASTKIEQVLRRVQPSPDSGVFATKPSAEVVRKSAELLVKQGKLMQAAEALEGAEDLVRAAEVYELAKEYEKAGEAYLRAEMAAKAESCYSRVEDPTKLADFRARLAAQRGDYRDAGNYWVEANKLSQAVDAFKKAKDYVSAAQTYEKMKRFMLAGDMYSTARDLNAAGHAYAKGHDWRNASECFETCGELTQAVEAHVHAGNFFRAGLLSMRNNSLDKAVEYLQRVPASSADYKLAMGYLGAAFFGLGKLPMAEDVLSRVGDQIPPTPDTLPIIYAHGRVLEDVNPAAAMGVFRRILTVDNKYSDVNQRITQLEQMLHISNRQDSQIRTRPLTGGGISQELTQPQFTEPTVYNRANTQTQGTGSFRLQTLADETRFGEEGRYQILAELGRGGTAIVYKAFDTHLHREVVLKTFPLSRQARAGNDEVFLQEARTIARLSHPYIATVYDCGRMNFLYYLAAEFVAGENLKQYVKRRGPMSLDEVRSTLDQVSQALDYAHGRQVLHLNMKPANVIMRNSTELKVVDFGLAQILSDAATSAPVGPGADEQATQILSPHYLAPEQILGEAVDIRTDIYALGLVLFYLLTGKTPFELKRINDPIEISRLQVQSSFPAPSMLRATLPRKVDVVFSTCTQKNPTDRYGSISEFIAELRKV